MVVRLSHRELDLPKIEIGRLLEIAAEHKEIISLGPGEPDFNMPEPLVEHLKKIANKCNHYSPPGGRHEFKEAIIKKLKKENKIKAKPENIVVTCGSQEALMIASACTMDAGDEMMIPDPSFFAYLPTIELFNAAPIFVPVKEEEGFALNPDEVKKRIVPGKTKVLLINSPCNPTGNVLKKNILEELADIAVDNDMYIFSDEAYEKVIFDDAKHVSIGSLNGMEDNTASFFSFSKTHAMCGFRLGFCVCNPKLAEAITKTHIYTTICAPTVSQKLGTRALSLPSLYTDKMVTQYQRRVRLMLTRLNEMGLFCVEPKGAFYCFPNIQSVAKDSKKFAYDLLKKAKVAVVPGVDFGTNGEGHVRCSCATDIQLIEKAMDKLEDYIKKIKQKRLRR
ncbi:aminotransferase class I/II-fold pyridoxal phosphate-dependent enzyme [Candidatus Woesearchaeota archaeon]|nr:aminotransferase class I/II-fold pyridoxal phosphate-dependent enzyme [Candidatus Woesearchaeota archaeon]